MRLGTYISSIDWRQHDDNQLKYSDDGSDHRRTESLLDSLKRTCSISNAVNTTAKPRPPRPRPYRVGRKKTKPQTLVHVFAKLTYAVISNDYVMPHFPQIVPLKDYFENQSKFGENMDTIPKLTFSVHPV